MFVFRILNGGGENKYPAPSFVLNCKGAQINLNNHGPWMVICLFIGFGTMTPSKRKTEDYRVGIGFLSGILSVKATMRG